MSLPSSDESKKSIFNVKLSSKNDIPSRSLSESISKIDLIQSKRCCANSKNEYKILLCKVCFNNHIETTFFPCGSALSCLECAQNLLDCAYKLLSTNRSDSSNFNMSTFHKVIPSYDGRPSTLIYS